MAHKPWPVFGLEGRSAEEVRDAVALGYRRFDAGERYGTTTGELAGAIRDGGVDREGVEVLYRFDVRADETRDELRTRLQGVAAEFGGHLDAAVIGNLDASEEKVKEAWVVLGELKEEGTVRQAGVAGVAPRHANLLVDLRQDGRVDVVDFAPQAPGQGQGQGAAEGWRKNLLDALGGDEDLRYYKVVRALGELLGRAARTQQASQLPQAPRTPPAPQEPQEPLTPSAPQASHAPATSPAPPRPAHTPQVSQPPRTPQGPQLSPRLPAGQQPAPRTSYRPQDPAPSVHTPDSVLRDDDTPLPDGIRELLVPLYEEPERLRAEVRAYAAGGAVDRETVSRWLMEERGFTREELEGVTVPDRVGLRGEFRDMRLADVLAGHLGPDPRNQAVAHELGYALLHGPGTWNEVRPALSTVAYPSSPPPSVADAAALRSVHTESPGQGPTRNGETATVGLPPRIASAAISRTL
ncbi:aldo/keto reductase [Streptomyces sp. NPDC051987]|uniref:aldo/keto reductase n=1 Tax=Streptomyces sp. NPDC051987 TaxID=3155808 RepID=UPI003427FC64